MRAATAVEMPTDAGLGSDGTPSTFFLTPRSCKVVMKTLVAWERSDEEEGVLHLEGEVGCP